MATITGNDLSALVEQAGSPVLEWQQTDAAALPALRVTRTYIIDKAAALSAIPSIDTPDTTWSAAVLKSFTVTTNEVEAIVALTFTTPDWSSTGVPLHANESSYEFDCGVIQVPIESHKYFATADGDGAAIAPEDISKVRSLLSYAKATVSGGTVNGKDEEGNAISVTGKAAILFDYLLRGQETVDIIAPIFRKTTNRTSHDWSIGNLNKCELPPLPGSATLPVPWNSASKWRKTAIRKIERRTAGGTSWDKCEEWTASPEGWNLKLYPLAT